MTLSPRVKFARIVLGIGVVTFIVVMAIVMRHSPTDEQMVNTPSGEYAR